MIGDQADMLGRLKSVLPQTWFPSTAPGSASATPVLDGLLSSAAYAGAWLYSMIAYVRSQTRIATATDVFLDLVAGDFFGSRIVRRAGQGDASFRSRITTEVLRPRATRPALIQALTDLTGTAPIVFEPRWPPDTGGIGFLGMTQGTGLEIGGASVAGAGGVGSLLLPFQFFVTAFPAGGGGIGGVMGAYYGSGAAYGGIGKLSDGGASAGAIEIASLLMSEGQITADDINATIASVLPVATIAWTRIAA